MLKYLPGGHVGIITSIARTGRKNNGTYNNKNSGRIVHVKCLNVIVKNNNLFIYVAGWSDQKLNKYPENKKICINQVICLNYCVQTTPINADIIP